MKSKKILVIIIAGFFLSIAVQNTIATEDPGGIGLSVLQLYHHETKDHKGPIVVLDVLPNGSAIKAGIERGDIITHIDNEETSGKDFMYILEDMLRGPAYTSVALTIKRTSTNKTFTLTLDRVESKSLY
jgi:carboxyl-terminal processing protease